MKYNLLHIHTRDAGTLAMGILQIKDPVEQKQNQQGGVK